MAERVVLVCDEPRCAREAETYQIVLPGEQVARKVELCGVHAKTIRELALRGRKEKLPKGTRKTFTVTPLND